MQLAGHGETNYVTPRLDVQGRVMKEQSDLRLEKNVKESLLSGTRRSKKGWGSYASGIDMRETKMRWIILGLTCSIMCIA